MHNERLADLHDSSRGVDRRPASCPLIPQFRRSGFLTRRLDVAQFNCAAHYRGNVIERPPLFSHNARRRYTSGLCVIINSQSLLGRIAERADLTNNMPINCRDAERLAISPLHENGRSIISTYRQ